ncbi:hypothetical protein D3C87_77810 [compost metagenome]
MNEETCLIPRNLRKPDIIVQTPMKLTLKQLAYIGAGIGGAYLIFTCPVPIIIKGVMVVGSAGLGFVGALFKYEDSSIDELAIDSVVYLQRKNYYHQLNKRGGLVVNIGARKETITA